MSARPVVLREEQVSLPTYGVGPGDPNPLFYDGRAYQGARGPIYPLAMLDRLSRQKADRVCRVLFLENEYIEISVIPE